MQAAKHWDLSRIALRPTDGDGTFLDYFVEIDGEKISSYYARLHFNDQGGTWELTTPIATAKIQAHDRSDEADNEVRAWFANQVDIELGAAGQKANESAGLSVSGKRDAAGRRIADLIGDIARQCALVANDPRFKTGDGLDFIGRKLAELRGFLTATIGLGADHDYVKKLAYLDAKYRALEDAFDGDADLKPAADALRKDANTLLAHLKHDSDFWGESAALAGRIVAEAERDITFKKVAQAGNHSEWQVLIKGRHDDRFHVKLHEIEKEWAVSFSNNPADKVMKDRVDFIIPSDGGDETALENWVFGELYWSSMNFRENAGHLAEANTAYDDLDLDDVRLADLSPMITLANDVRLSPKGRGHYGKIAKLNTWFGALADSGKLDAWPAAKARVKSLMDASGSNWDSRRGGMSPVQDALHDLRRLVNLSKNEGVEGTSFAESVFAEGRPYADGKTQLDYLIHTVDRIGSDVSLKLKGRLAMAKRLFADMKGKPPLSDYPEVVAHIEKLAAESDDNWSSRLDGDPAGPIGRVLINLRGRIEGDFTGDIIPASHFPKKRWQGWPPRVVEPASSPSFAESVFAENDADGYDTCGACGAVTDIETLDNEGGYCLAEGHNPDYLADEVKQPLFVPPQKIGLAYETERIRLGNGEIIDDVVEGSERIEIGGRPDKRFVVRDAAPGEHMDWRLAFGSDTVVFVSHADLLTAAAVLAFGRDGKLAAKYDGEPRPCDVNSERARSCPETIRRNDDAVFALVAEKYGGHEVEIHCEYCHDSDYAQCSGCGEWMTDDGFDPEYAGYCRSCS